MSRKDETKKYVVGSILSEMGWNHGTGSKTKALIAIIRGGADQVFVGFGNGWSLQQPTKNSPTQTLARVTHLQQGWNWNSWFGDNGTNVGKITESDILLANDKNHQRLGKLVEIATDIVEEQDKDSNETTLTGPNGEMVWIHYPKNMTFGYTYERGQETEQGSKPVSL